jgi:hypothetical protein
MAKKRSHPEAAPKAALVLSTQATQQRALKEADAVWAKTTEAAIKAYDQVMHGAWSRYMSALKIHHDTHGKKAKSGGTDFDKKYDQDRENALRQWNLATAVADKNLKKVQDQLGDVPTDESE